MTQITNHTELAAYLGASDESEESISRRVYNDTACGAWAHLEDAIPVGTWTTDTWMLDIKPSAFGLALVRARSAYGNWLRPQDVPEEVLDTLFRPVFDHGYCVLTDEETIQFIHDNPVTRAKPFYTVEGVRTYSGGYAQGVSFGSIVEGVEQCTTVYTVAYPCEETEIKRAIENVEAEARDIWNLTHGCPHCWPTGQPGEDYHPGDEWLAGDTIVNFKCEHCHGLGIVI